MQNEENIKKTRKPRKPRLERKFANLQELVTEIQTEVKTALDKAKAPKQLNAADFDFSQLSTPELLRLQVEISNLLLSKNKEI